MIKVKVFTPNGAYKEIETPILNIGSVDGERGLLPNHMNTIFALAISKMETEENGVRHYYAISGGMLYFKDNVANIFVNAIESKEEIDLERAQKAKVKAEESIRRKNPDIDLMVAELALRRALNRIKIYNYPD
ncbi:MAG: F0F1 ATP synthase subunit epsilon [Erysipelotrichaceae bacterium]|jgi:F-type H+-transporting ATPase subunit epsilon|nr:F0F1 ATP synthase subunit epsilon [Erysipelotrichaceae bacterium]